MHLTYRQNTLLLYIKVLFNNLAPQMIFCCNTVDAAKSFQTVDSAMFCKGRDAQKFLRSP